MLKRKLQIREVTDVIDLKLIRSIALNTWPHTFANILTPDQIEYMLEMMYSISSLEDQLNVRGHEFAIGFEDNKPVGFAGYELNIEKSVIKIHKLYFLPEAQGKGYGKSMIDYLIEASLKYNIENITLNVNRFNKAIGFYNHLGFKISGEEVIDIGSGYVMDDYVMHLALT